MKKPKPEYKVVISYSTCLQNAAIFLGDDEGSTRIAGGKCYGPIFDIATYNLKVTDLDNLIEAARYYKKQLKKANKKKEK